VTFSPGGLLVASSSAHRTVRLWGVDASPKLLCDKLTTNMTHERWSAEISPDIPYVTLCPGLPVPAG
jgi:hypothetical protein